MTPNGIPRTSECRTDLIRLEDKNTPRHWTLIDAISGRITRLRRRDWDHLQRSSACLDRELFTQAAAAGLMRQRIIRHSRRTSWPLRILAFRVPLLSADRLAVWLAARTAVLFSLPAVTLWMALALVAATSVLIGWNRAQSTLALLYESSGSVAALGYASAVVFVLTKCLHELAHATVCRRMGVPVGDLGLYFFCGLPCPYCDVSQVWRSDSRLQRAAVMMAGVYAELALATAATLVWWLTATGPAHLLAMNVMMVSGVSAIVFNANALMRLDAYYVLSDAVGSPNLKRQASLAWSSLVMTRLAGISQGRARLTLGDSALSLYHALSTGYQWMVAAVIVMFLMTLLDEWNLWWVGVAMIATLVCMLMLRMSQRWFGMLLGRGIWSMSARVRRLSLSAIALATLAAVLWLPLRREVRVSGYVDLADAVEIFVPESAWVERVEREFGDRVEAGEPLARLANEQLTVQLASAKSRRTLATLESAHLKREVLESAGGDAAWKLDRANRDLVEAQYQALASRQARLRMTAPNGGVVLPTRNLGDAPQPAALLDRQGTLVSENAPWCRVGDPTRTCLKLRVTAAQRQQLRIGNPAQVIMDDGTVRRISTTIQAIDEIPTQQRIEGDAAAFVVKCDLAGDSFRAAGYTPLGHHAEARICIEREPVWKWLRRMISETLRG